jgi:serine/threonine-protein kinase SRPK3
MKILKSENSRGNSELAILRSVRHTNIVQCLDHFWIRSPNGFHLCIVMEATGPAIRLYVDLLWYGRTVDSPMAVDLTRKCVIALKALHDLGYAHGG